MFPPRRHPGYGVRPRRRSHRLYPFFVGRVFLPPDSSSAVLGFGGLYHGPAWPLKCWRETILFFSQDWRDKNQIPTSLVIT